jgi:general secretion pathway protein M
MSEGRTKLLVAPAAAWWQGLAARERLWLSWGGALLAAALLWWVGVQPAWKTVSQAPAEHERLDAQLQQMQREAADAQQMRALPTLPVDEAGLALRAATDRLGTKARLVLQGERATVTFTGVGSAALRDWLGEARAGARARPVEANLARGPQGFNGTVILALGGNP